MLRTLRTVALSALAAVLISGLSAGAASARGGHHGGGGFHSGGFHHFGGFHHGFRHFGPRFGIGFYAPYDYYYGPDCFIRRQVFINRFGHRIVRFVRVCY